MDRVIYKIAPRDIQGLSVALDFTMRACLCQLDTITQQLLCGYFLRSNGKGSFETLEFEDSEDVSFIIDDIVKLTGRSKTQFDGIYNDKTSKIAKIAYEIKGILDSNCNDTEVIKSPNKSLYSESDEVSDYHLIRNEQYIELILTHEQVRVIKKSLELYLNLGLGNYRELVDWFSSGDIRVIDNNLIESESDSSLSKGITSKFIFELMIQITKLEKIIPHNDSETLLIEKVNDELFIRSIWGLMSSLDDLIISDSELRRFMAVSALR